MARRPFVAGNWKMNTTEAEAESLAKGVAAISTGTCDVGVGVPFVHLATVRAALGPSGVKLGAQDVYWEVKGAFTGEVSVAMLEDYCSFVIIGHSERRQFFGDTDEWVNRKLKAVMASSKLDPIVCVGETLAQRQAGETEAVLARQIAGAFEGVELAERITVAYEPVWAIGTGETATPEIAQAACAFIREELAKLSPGASETMRIQYGGSVTPESAGTLLALSDIDGALVGGASLKAEQFAAIVAAAG